MMGSHEVASFTMIMNFVMEMADILKPTIYKRRGKFRTSIDASDSATAQPPSPIPFFGFICTPAPWDEERTLGLESSYHDPHEDRDNGV
jgi:hypothetical protein